MLTKSLAILTILLGSSLCATTTTTTPSAAPFGERWRWAHFTSESGLPSDGINDIFEASDSSVYVTTMAGIARFDGFLWRTIFTPSATIDGEYGNGVLLRRGDSLFAVGKNESPRLLLTDVSTAVPLTGDSLLLSRGGRFFIGARDAAGAFRITPASMLGGASRAYKTRSGTLWWEAGRNLFRLRHGAPEVFLASPAGRILAGGGTRGEIQISDGEEHSGVISLLLPNEMQGLWEWSGTAAPRHPATEPPDVVNALAVGPHGDAIAAYRANVVRYRSGGRWAPVDFQSVGITEIRAFHFLMNGDLVVGTDHGVFWYRVAPTRWASLRHPPPDLRNSVNEIVLDTNGAIWAATSAGLEVRDADGGTRLIQTIGTTRLSSLTGLCADPSGRIWISSGSAFPGVFRWNGSSWTHLVPGPDSAGVAVHKIRRDRGGSIWLLGVGINSAVNPRGQPGAYLYEGGEFHRWGEPEGLLHGRVYAFAEAADSSLWFGTARGLSRWRRDPSQPPGGRRIPSRGRWRHWRTSDGIGGDRIFALAADGRGRVWFAAWGGYGSLGYIDQNDSAVIVRREGSFDFNYVFDIVGDEAEGVWVATDRGIFHVDGDEVLQYDAKTGLPYDETFCLLRDGERLYIGTQGMGVAVLDCAVPLPPAPRIFTEPAVDENGSVLVRWTAQSSRGETPPKEIFARFSLDHGPWSPWAQRSSATFRTLGAGPHDVMVQAKGLNGQYDRDGARIAFTVAPPLFLRPAVLYPGLAGAAGILALTGTLLWRKRQYDRSLRASEERHRRITELMSDFAYLETVRDDGTRAVAWLTESFTRLTGYSLDDARRGAFLELAIHQDDRPLLDARIRALLGGQPMESELRLALSNGELLWIRDYAIPVLEPRTGRVTLIYGIVRDITQRKNDEEQLRRLANDLSRTEEYERRRMATFLHDAVSQSLLLSKRKLEAVRSVPPLPPGADAAIGEVLRHLQESIDSARTLTIDLCPPILYDLGLGPAIDWLAEQMEEAHGIRVEFVDDGRPKPIAPEMRTVLYSGARELLMNIVKHSSAGCAWIDLRRADGEIVLAVEDDGVGFEPGRIPGARRPGGDGAGFGLLNLRERMRHLGGRLEIEAGKERGARISLCAPVQREEQKGTD